MKTVQTVMKEIHELKDKKEKLANIGNKAFHNSEINDYLEREFGVNKMFFLGLATEYENRANALETKLFEMEVDL